MEITHNSYFGGEVQSLGFTRSNGKKATIGVISPGRHDFGIAKAPEEITIIFNKIIINGKECQAIMSCHINPGDPIVFEAAGPAAYICYYPE